MLGDAVLRPLADALALRVEPVRAAALASGAVRLLSIRFDGSMDERATPASAIAGRLFRAQPGDLVFSKIDVRNGAVGLVPAEFANAAFTAEFPVHAVRGDVALPEFLALVVRSALFRQAINGLISGASGRKRVAPADFLGVRVPLPSLPAQRAIVAAWQHDQAAAQALLAEADGLEAQARAAFAAALGVADAAPSKARRAFALNWADVEGWTVDAARGGTTPSTAAQGHFPRMQLGELLTRIQYGTSEKANSEGRGVPVLRMGNIQAGGLDFIQLKHVELSPPDVARWALTTGDLLVNRTNSKDLVGKCAVFGAQGTYVFASYLIRLQLNGSKVLPEFVGEVLNGPIGRRQIDALSRQIIGQANINSVELKSLWIPLPPLDVQQRLLAELESVGAKRSLLRQQAHQRFAAAHDNLERQLRGQLPMEPA